MTSSPIYLEFTDVRKRFRQREVLRGVSLRFDHPAIVGIIGANGAGKTTLLRLAAGILIPTEGFVRVFSASPTREREVIGRRIGALIERAGHYDEQTVEDNLAFYLRFYCLHATEAELRGCVSASLAAFGLGEVRRERVGELSFGIRQRLALARAMHPAANLILLDEPLDSLDPLMRGEVKSALRERVGRGALVLLSSHNLVDIAGLCDDVLFVTGGRVFGVPDLREPWQRGRQPTAEDLEQVYADLAHRYAHA